MRTEKMKFLILPVTAGILALVLTYLISYYAYNNNILIGANDVTWNTVLNKFICDYLVMLLIPSIILIANKKNLHEFRLCFNSKYEILFLSGIMLVLFFLHGNFTVSGLYSFFFYLIVVAFGEEFIFRGFIYNRIKYKSKVWAIIVSGILWGVGHAILPAVIWDYSMIQLLIVICSQIGGGILMGWYFIYLQEKSKTLWIPVLVHAILDYTVGGIGIITAIFVFAYFFLNSRRGLIKD